MQPFAEVHCPVALLAYCQQSVAETKPNIKTEKTKINVEKTNNFLFLPIITTFVNEVYTLQTINLLINLS